jgi:hypothetical protein
LTNEKVIEINQNSTNNQEILRNPNWRVWTANHKDKELTYFAFINVSEEDLLFDQNLVDLSQYHTKEDLWNNEIIADLSKVSVEKHGVLLLSCI